MHTVLACSSSDPVLLGHARSTCRDPCVALLSSSYLRDVLVEILGDEVDTIDVAPVPSSGKGGRIDVVLTTKKAAAREHESDDTKQKRTRVFDPTLVGCPPLVAVGPRLDEVTTTLICIATQRTRNIHHSSIAHAACL